MHKKRKERKPCSMKKKIFLWMSVFLFPILVILIICMTFITKSYERQMQEYAGQLIHPFTAQIDTVLSSAIRYIGGKTIDLGVMEKQDDKSRLDAIEQMKALGDEFSEELSVQDDINAVWMWNGEKMWFVQNYNQSYVQNDQAAESLEQILKKKSGEELIFQEGYQSFESEDLYYLFLAMDVEGGRIGCWFSVESLLEEIENADLPGLEAVMFQDAQENLLNGEFDKDSEEMNAYFVSESKMQSVPFSIVALWDKKVIFQPFNSLVQVVMVCLIIVTVLFLSYLVSVQKSVIRPLERMIKVIGHVKKEEIDEIEVNKKEPAEIQSVFLALNDLIQKVRNLKIRVYEEQLTEQETKLQLYQLQIRPHFFLNVLNNIVSFARSNNYQMVQKMTLFLAGHCRYILYHTWHVTLEEELEYTQNYMNMQQIQSEKENLYTAEAEEEVLGCKIPILCIQIFVENSMKYARKNKEEIRILVRAGKWKTKGEEKLWITIDDSGEGFTQEQIKQLQEENDRVYKRGKDHGIGIANVRQRLKILYGDQANISFSNNEKGGAHIKIDLPFCEK